MSVRTSMRFYGNTQAHVLDNYKSGSFADALANRVLVVKEGRIGELTAMPEVDDYDDKPAGCRESYKVFKKYREYKKLFGERLHAADYPSTASDPKIVDFTRLPGELRNRIYRFFLVMEPAMELLPKTSIDDRRTPGYVHQRAMERYAKKKPMLPLLRLNKVINAEASDIFYSENEFRFTNQEGWFYLRAFLETIGVKNTARLRHIAVHVPWEGESTDRHCVPTIMCPDHLELLLSGNGLLPKGAVCQPDPMPRCLKLFSASGTLSKLDLVVPCGFAIEGFPRLPLDADNFAPGFSIKLLRLRKLGIGEPPDISQFPMRRMTRVKEGDEVVEYA